MIESATVNVVVKPGYGSTTYLLTGPSEAIDAKIASIMREFNEWVYGTKITQRTPTSATVWRSNTSMLD